MSAGALIDSALLDAANKKIHQLEVDLATMVVALNGSQQREPGALVNQLANRLDHEMRMLGCDGWELNGVADRRLVTEAREKNQQLKADLTTIRAALKRTGDEKLEALRMHAKTMDLIHAEDGYIASQDMLQGKITKLRELIRDCPLLKIEQPEAFVASSHMKWIERAKEEVLKL